MLSRNQQRNEWQRLITLLKKACDDDVIDEFCQLIFTFDEREALTMRINIIHALLNGTFSQREIKEQLNVGIATITRGSTSLKTASPTFIHWLQQQLALLK